VAAPWVPVGTHGTSLAPLALALSTAHPSSNPSHARVSRSISPLPRQAPSAAGLCTSVTPRHPVAVSVAPVGNNLVHEQRLVIAPQVPLVPSTLPQATTAWGTPQSSPRVRFRELQLLPPGAVTAAPVTGAATGSSRSVLLPPRTDRSDCHNARRSSSPTASSEQATLPESLGTRRSGSSVQQPLQLRQQQPQQQQRGVARNGGAELQPSSFHLCGSVKSGGSATLGSTLGSFSDSREEGSPDICELRRLLSASLAAQEVLLHQQQEQRALQYQSNEQLAACMAEFRATRQELATISREVEVLRRAQQHCEGSNDQTVGRLSRPSSESAARPRQRRAAQFTTPPSKEDSSREGLSSASSPATRTASPPSARAPLRVASPGPRASFVGLRGSARAANSQSSGALPAMNSDFSWQKLQQHRQQEQWQQQQQQTIWCPRSGGKTEKRHPQEPG